MTPEIDVNDMPGTTLSFELHQRPWQETGDEYFEVWWIDQDEATPTWQRVFQDRNDKAQQVETVVLSIPDAAESTAVQLAFVVHGNNTGDGLWEWDIDNIVFGFADPASGLFARHRGDVVTNGGSAYEPATVAGAANFVGDLALENFGTSDDVLVTSIELTGESNVTVHTDDLSLPASALQSGESFELDNIYFTPDTAGAWSFTIEVESDAANAATYEIVVTGVAASAAGDLAGSVGQDTLPGAHPNVTSPRSLILDVHRDTVIRSAVMDAEDAATVEVELRDRHGELLHAGTFNLSGTGGDVVEFDWFVPAGRGYRLIRVSSTELMQTQSNANYPYVSNTVSIMGTDNNMSWYYFFYDIQFGADWETSVQRDSNDVDLASTDDLGALAENQITEVVYDVHNEDAMPMAAIEVEIDNLDNVDVTVLSQPGRIDPNETGQIVLEVMPLDMGAFSFGVSVLNSDPEANPFTFTAEGEGVEPPEDPDSESSGCALGTGSTPSVALMLLAALFALGLMRRRLR